jgi:hypothetical protein
MSRLSRTFADAIAAWRPAIAAKVQGEAAWEHVNLQRLRPVIIIEEDWILEKESDDPDGFLKITRQSDVRLLT